MIDLTEARALAAAARADTSDGLEAREKLADVVDALAAGIEAMSDPNEPQRGQWATRMRHPDGTEEVTFPVDEWLAGKRAAEYPTMHTALLRRTVTFGPWIEVTDD